MQSKLLVIVSMAIMGAMANPAQSQLGVEVVRRDDGTAVVREVLRPLKRTCTGCVHVGGACTIGEGNCYRSENALCTDCGNGRVICVDQEGGSCEAP